MRKKLLILSCFFLHVNIGSAQINNLFFQNINRSNGLPINDINCLAQDSSGFIWIGSFEGLYRYDGFNYKGYYADAKRENSLPSNWIAKICVTRKGLLWIGTRGGLAIMGSNGKVMKVINSTTSALFNADANWVTDLKEDKQANIWITTFDGLFKISADGKKIDRFNIDRSIDPYNHFYGFFFDEVGKLWIGTRAGLRIFDPEKMSFVDLTGSAFEHLGNNVIASSIIHKGKFWYSTWTPDFAVYDTIKKTNSILYSGKNEPTPDYSQMSFTMYIDTKNTLWIGRNNGLLIVQPNDERITFSNEPSNLQSLIGNVVRMILEDRDGNFWIATNEGISIARPYRQWVDNFSINNIRQYPFGNKLVSEIVEIDSNNYFVGTSDPGAEGLYLTDSNFNIKKKFSFNNWKYDWIWKHYKDEPRKRIYISTQEGMLVYNKITGTLTIEKKGLFDKWKNFASFISTSDSIVWISAFRNRFARYNLMTGAFKEYEMSSLGLKNDLLYLEKDSANKIWIIAVQEGIYQFDEQQEKIVQGLKKGDSSQSIKRQGIQFFKDIGDYFIIGYQASGISLYHKKTNTYSHYSRSEGLSSDVVRGAVLAKDGTVWITTNNGISQFDPVSKKINSYGYEDGILNNNFENITQLSDGRIVAGSAKGMIVFRPSKIQALKRPPLPPVFTNVHVDGQVIFVDSLLENNRPLYISYKKDYFSIEFISLKYNSSRKLEYAFMLEGLDPDWVFAGERRSVTYSKLKGGNYKFYVRVREPGGQWVEAKHNLPVFIQTPFFEQWWFYALCATLVGAIVYAMFRYRLQQLLKIEKMRTAISGDLHDEIGSSLTSISIFSQMAMKNLSADSKEEEYLQRIGARSRESIDKMSDIVWTINPDNDSLEQIVVRMKNYSTEISEAKDILVHWNEWGKLSHFKMTMEQRKNFYLLFKEVINNAIKHSEAKNINIDLAAISNKIQLRIQDDGIGFVMEEKTTGNGLKNIQRRANTLNGDLQINSSPGTGTSIMLKIPTN